MILYAIIFFVAIAYLALIFAYSIGLKKVISEKKSNTNEKTNLSVIVAFRNEEKNLPILLDALLKQTLSGILYELIFVDDHSTDGSVSIVNSYKDRFIRLVQVASPVQVEGKKAALIYGVSHAQNPIVVFIDADCIPTDTWLETLSSRFSGDVDFAIGPVVLSPIDSFVRKLQSLEYSSLMAAAAGSFGIGHPVIASSANLAFRRELLSVNSDSMQSNVSSGDDMFLLHSAKKNVCKIDFLNDYNAIVHTNTEPTLSSALRQRMRWASKSIYYKDFDTIFTSIVVFTFNLLLFGLIVASFILIKYLFIFLCLLCAKSIVDFLLLRQYLRFTKQEELVKVFLPLQFLYPLYVVYTFFSGVIIKTTWKGRRIR